MIFRKWLAEQWAALTSQGLIAEKEYYDALDQADAVAGNANARRSTDCNLSLIEG
jgi:hypothetical protein